MLLPILHRSHCMDRSTVYHCSYLSVLNHSHEVVYMCECMFVYVLEGVGVERRYMIAILSVRKYVRESIQ